MKCGRDGIGQSALQRQPGINFLIEQETDQSRNGKCRPEGDHESKHITGRNLNRPEADFGAKEITSAAKHPLGEQELLHENEGPEDNRDELQAAPDLPTQLISMP